MTVNQGLCTGCGTCVSLCPNKAITISMDKGQGIYLPQIDSTKCCHCQLCYKVCPGVAVNFKQLSKSANLVQTARSFNQLLGNYLNCYAGYSTDNTIRFHASSGGIVTQLLVFALEKGLIDGALVTRMKKDNPLEPEPFIARTVEDITASSKSKYCPVPANLALREILECDGKYAFVGLPCHIHGLRKAQLVNKKLFDRIVFCIGLFCSHGDNFFLTRYLLDRLHVDRTKVKQISYRGKGWPGRLSIELKSSKIVGIGYTDWIRIHEYCFFTPQRCLLCCDGTAELADISTGDAWIPEFGRDKIGTSILTSRTSHGDMFLQSVSKNCKINIFPVASERLLMSQGNLRFKKYGFITRKFILKMWGKTSPNYDLEFPKSSLIEVPRSAIIFSNRYIASKPCFRSFMSQFAPFQIHLKKLYASSTSTEFR